MKYLEFEKRGCNFFPGDKDNEESDIGNYRICTPGENVLSEMNSMCKEENNYTLTVEVSA